MIDNSQYGSYDKNYTYSTVLPRKASGSSHVNVISSNGQELNPRPQTAGANLVSVSQAPETDAPFVKPVSHIQRFSKNIVNTNAFVTYHLDDETGRLIETAVSPSRNYVTARSVNSAQEVTPNFSSDVNMNQTGPDLNDRTHPRRYEYTTATLAGGDAYRPAYMKNNPYATRGNEIVHPKVVGRLPERQYSNTEIHQQMNTNDQGVVLVDRLPRGRRKSPDGSPRRSKHGQIRDDVKVGTAGRKGVSTLSTNSSSTPKEEKSPPKVKLLMKLIGDRHGSKKYKRHTSLDAGDGELRGTGSTDRHVVSSLFITVPGSENAKKEGSEKRSPRRERKRRSRKSRTLPPRYGSLDSLTRHYTSGGHTYSHSATYVPNVGSPEVIYVGQDGQLYVPDVANPGATYPYNGNHMFYPEMDFYNVKSESEDEDDSSSDDSSTGESSEHEAAWTHGRHKSRRRGSSKKISSLSDGDEKYHRAKHRHRSTRSSSFRRHHEYDRLRSKRRHSLRSRSSSSTECTDESDAKREKSRTKIPADCSNTKLRQQKPKAPSAETAGVSNVAVHPENSPSFVQQPSFAPSNPIDNNFTLSPSARFFPNIPNPYLGFPSSTTPGPIDQILRNTHFNLASMKTYLDAMSTSLSNIPFSTITTNLPYQHQGAVGQPQSDSLDKIETQDFFRSSNPALSSVPLKSPVHGRPRMALPREEPFHMGEEVYATVDSSSTITDYLVDVVPKPSRFKKSAAIKHVSLQSTEGTLESKANKYSTPYSIEDVIDKGTQVRAFVGTPQSNRRKVTKPKDHGLFEEVKLRPVRRIDHSKTNAAVQTDQETSNSQPPIPPPLPTSERPNRISRSDSSAPDRKFFQQRSVSKDSETQTLKSPPATFPKPKWFSSKLKKTESRATENNKTSLSNDVNGNAPPAPVGPNVFTNQEPPPPAVKELQEKSEKSDEKNESVVHPEADYDVYPRKPVSMCNRDLSRLDQFIQVDKPQSALMYSPNSLPRSRFERHHFQELIANGYHTLPNPQRRYIGDDSHNLHSGQHRSPVRSPLLERTQRILSGYYSPTLTRKNFKPQPYSPPSQKKDLSQTIHSPLSHRKENIPMSYSPMSPRRKHVLSTHSPLSPRREQVLSTHSPLSPRREQVLSTHSPLSPRREQVLSKYSPLSPRREQVLSTNSPLSPMREHVLSPYSPRNVNVPFTKSPISPRRNLVSTTQSPPSFRKENIHLTRSPLSPSKELFSPTSVQRSPVKYSPPSKIPYRDLSVTSPEFSSWYIYPSKLSPSPHQKSPFDQSTSHISQIRSLATQAPVQSARLSSLLSPALGQWQDKTHFHHFSPTIQSLDLRWENRLPVMSPNTYSLEKSTLLQRRAYMAHDQPSVTRYASDVDLRSPRLRAAEPSDHHLRPPPSPLPTYSVSPSPVPPYRTHPVTFKDPDQHKLSPDIPISSPRYRSQSPNMSSHERKPPSPLPTYSQTPSPVLFHKSSAMPTADQSHILQDYQPQNRSEQPPVLSPTSPMHAFPNSIEREGTAAALSCEAVTEFREAPYIIYRGDPLILGASVKKNSPSGLISPLPSMMQPEQMTDTQPFEPTSVTTNGAYTFCRGKSFVEKRQEESVMSPVSAAPTPQSSKHMEDTTANPANQSPQSDLGDATSGATAQKGEVPIPPRDFDSDADDSEYMYTLKGWSKLRKGTDSQTVMFCMGSQDQSQKIFEKMFSKSDVTYKEYSFLSKFFDDSVPKYNPSTCCFTDLKKLMSVVLSDCTDKDFKCIVYSPDTSETSCSSSLQHSSSPGQPWKSLSSLAEESCLCRPFSISNNDQSFQDSVLCKKDSFCMSEVDNFCKSWKDVLTRGEIEYELPTSINTSPALNTVFMKETFEKRLDTESNKIKTRAVLRLQTHIRMFIVHRRHQKLRKSALKIQRMIRMWKTRFHFNKLRDGIVLAQAQFRMLRQRKRYLKTREEVRTRLEEHRLARKKQELEERIEKERKERQAQMMASIANLDIPGELALVYSKIDDWNPSHNGQHIITSSVDVVSMDMGYKLPVDINSHAFSKYTSVYFKNPNWGVQMEPIKSPLLPVQGEDSPAKALAVFKLILRFMCDTHMSEKKEKVLCDFIVQMGLKYESLRDEILCQLVNQTWQNQNMERIERVWRLLANCLCCFNPSSTLFKYLLKYVSDVGLNGYKYLCQHKILQSAHMDPLLSRVYPPTFLEWQAIQRKANMGLEVKFPDDVALVGHVESWTSGELFASHLCKIRGLHENSQGWTVRLQDDAEYYELMGYDYVLDLVSEIEIAPGFPTCTAYFLVSVDRSKEGLQFRKKGNEGPHHGERERILLLSGPLPEMIKRTVPVVSEKEKIGVQKTSKRIQTNNVEDDLGFSTTSVLNQRPTEIIPVGLSENSKMNARYTNRSKANGINGDMSAINEDMELNGDLSRNILNARYFPDGEVKNLDKNDLSKSVLNNRYNRKSHVSHAKSGVPGQISRKHLSPTRDDAGNSDNTDWSHLVEDIFSSALNDHDEQNGRALGSRIKGGGKGVPGFETQQPLAPGFGFGLTHSVMQPQVPPLNLAGPAMPPVGLMGADPLQQLTAHQMAQQQAVLQAYLAQQQQQQQQQQQALYQASLQQQQQQQAQVALQASQQQTAVLKTALQQQELQNKLLKQSIEQEVLRQQLQQVQLAQPIIPQTLPGIIPQPRPAVIAPSVQPILSQNVQPVIPQSQFNALSPSSSFNSGYSALGLTNGTAPTHAHMNGTAQSDLESPRKVQFIKSSFENRQQTEVKSPPPPVAPKQVKNKMQFDFPSQGTATGAVTRTITITSTSTADVPVHHTHHTPPPPPPPVLSFADPPPLHSQPSVPPAPPPPPPPPFEIDREKGKFTIRDKSGKTRTVRIGKVVWPPPVEKEEKYNIQVGKLEIDEHVASNIEDRITGKKIWQKPASSVQPDQQPKSILKSGEDRTTKRTKSLVETSHFNTMKLLELKLGGAPSNEPKPKMVSEGVEANLYEKTIVKDEQPPPLPSTAPPKKVVKTTVTETIETRELKRASGEYAKRIEPAPIYNKVIESDLAKRPLPSLPPPEEPKQIIDYAAFERVITELYPQNKKFFLMYSKVPWTLQIRKEVFWPSEKLEKPLALHLIYCQVVSDVYNQACVRITKDQRIKMRSMLEGHGVNQHNYLTKDLKPQIKKVIVDTAKEWPTYFCRLFPIAASGQYSGVRYLGVSHTGLRLITRERNLVDDHLSVIEEIRFEDVIDIFLVNNCTLQLNLRTKSLIFQTTRAQQLKDMIDRFCHESEKGNKYVVAIKDYITRESTLLSFSKGEIIKLMDPEMKLENGWLYGSLNGIVGLFPSEYVSPLARHEVETSSSKPVLYQSQNMTNGISSNGALSNGFIRDPYLHDDKESDTSQGTLVQDGKYSMMEFAMLNFRESLEKYEMMRTEDGSIRGTVKMIENIKLQKMNNKENSTRGGADWSWKEQADLVKWTRSPIQASLLKMTSPDLNKLALECFIAIMRFMGDYPMGTNMTDFDCAKKILKTCHKYPQLRDEIFCQLCKQTTNNRSMNTKSKIRGWRLFALVAAYFDCSKELKPYLFKYLETTSTDTNRTYNNAAALCLNNLRKTFKYGGRKDVPLKEEVTALADGRNCKRIPFFYSGADAHEGMLQVKSCTVVEDAIEEVCISLNITDPVEMEEYTFFIRTGDGSFSKLNRSDYILDETAFHIRRQMPFDFIFQRTVWFFPLKHMDNEIYVEMMFHQSVLDYIEGFLVIKTGGKLPKETEVDIAYLGALLHKANNMMGTPTQKDLEALVPRFVRGSDVKPQHWLNKIHENLAAVSRMNPLDAKARFIDVLKRWRLFGSTFFHIKNIANISNESLLAVNYEGISFLRKDTHETIRSYSFGEILSTRRYKSDTNINYLDMKLGDLMVQQILRIETDQGSDISDLIGQYMQVQFRLFQAHLSDAECIFRIICLMQIVIDNVGIKK
ncbi:hypothetical protein Btru_073529 [Bulinus truncatus]|nr:hypothetical protein Btru_073529 [Bulinus truncatus]